jgi:hypothetical protein
MKNTRMMISDDKEKYTLKIVTESEFMKSKNKTIKEKQLKFALNLCKF